MSVGPSVGGFDPSNTRSGAQDPFQLSAIQKDKNSEEEEVFTNPGSKIFSFVAATLHFKKFIDRFINSAQSLTVSINTEKALIDLAEFKKLLEELSFEDKSHIPEFTQRLSIQWQKVCENCSGFEGEVHNLDLLSKEIVQFIKEIQAFPEGEDHTLGYYLNEHAGQEWIPFPFMNMLFNLHEEYRSSPETSQIGIWTQKIKTILGGFR